MTDDLAASRLLAPEDAERFVRRGHFAYESGHHGDAWLALELLFRDPKRLHDAATRLAAKLRPYPADIVCGPLVGGALVGARVALEFGAAFVLMHPRKGRYVIAPEMRSIFTGKRALIVDDVINAGAAALACAREIESLGGRVAALAALIVRESVDEQIAESHGFPVESLLAMRWSLWPASDCALCTTGVELTPTEV